MTIDSHGTTGWTESENPVTSTPAAPKTATKPAVTVTPTTTARPTCARSHPAPPSVPRK
ncbi:MAG TPA: hypothetical protein VFK43_09090 [Acidimicrobiales bacterium]|nr:hypothetical protein [Acidimicrobiales bacterium]